jgi:hypothetical protein
VLACTVGLIGCSTSSTSRDSATASADSGPGTDAQPASDSSARTDAAGATDGAVSADGERARDAARRDGPVGEGGGGQQSARIDFVVSGGGGSIAIKAHNCSGLYGTWNGTMVVSGGGSGQGTFTLPIDQTGKGSFSWSFPVTAAGGTVTYTGVGQAALQAGGTAMKADVTVTVVTAVGSSSGNFTDTPPILRGGYAPCGGN